MCWCEHVKRHVNEITKYGRMGLSVDSVQIREFCSGRNAFQKKEQWDRFKIDIPYCTSKITCQVIFHADHPEYAPDLILCDNSYFMELQDIKSLCCWQPNDKKCLLHVVQEFLTFYRKKQAHLLESYSRLHFEYMTVLGIEGITEADVEVLIIDKNTDAPVHFLIRLPVDLSQIPTLVTGENPGENAALLMITFQTQNGNRVTPTLHLSPAVKQAFGGALALRIPGFPVDGCLIDYIPEIIALLQNKIYVTVKSSDQRREYISAFLSYYGRSVIEFDACSFTYIALLLIWNDFHFLTHIKLPMLFPEEQPAFTFMSIYHTISGVPYSMKINDYPYSPRWDVDEMARRSRTFIFQYIPQFRDYTLTSRNA